MKAVSATDVTIVIPQYNHVELTSDCIRSLRNHDTKSWPILVVDDGSTSASRQVLASKRLLGTRIIEQDHLGVTAAWNRGAKEAGSRYLVFLNNDVLFHGPVIERLIQPLRDEGFLISGVALRRESDLPPSILKTSVPSSFLQGWCFAMSAETFRSLGGFDEALSVYWSDTDFQIRLNCKFGVRRNLVSCVADLPLRHLKHQTAHTLQHHRDVWKKDRETFMAKWCRNNRSESSLK